MNEREFCYWLRGFFEITGDDVIPTLTTEQITTIKEHLDLVFDKVTKTKSTLKVKTYCNEIKDLDKIWTDHLQTEIDKQMCSQLSMNLEKDCHCNKTQSPNDLDSEMYELINTKHTGISNRPLC